MLWINFFLCNSLIVYITIYHWLKYALVWKRNSRIYYQVEYLYWKNILSYIMYYFRNILVDNFRTIIINSQIKQQEIFLCGNVNGLSIIYLHVYVKFLISFFNSGFWMRLFGNRGLYWCTDVCLYWTARGRHLWVRKRQLTNLSKFRISLYSFLW